MVNAFPDMTDEEVEAWLKNESNFHCVRRLPDGEWIGIISLAFSLAVCVGITKMEIMKYRWCFSDSAAARKFYETATHLKEIPDEELQQSLVGHRHTSTALIILYDANGFPRWK